MRGSSPLPHRLVGSIARLFQKVLRLATDSLAGPNAMIHVRKDGWEEEAEKPCRKKERLWRRMLPNVPSLPIYFQED